ncbi:15 kDa selenoprotein [Tieghemostelium lacteum]|uniref:Selenoprotein F n=1 Tax=Tieghemostelium lacteum TaxID=361077 RepID=A0A151ZJJ4_TIELA|nr:15 kDa selenoprotein [Tieghemostelium lacteum]|eukprot:KYQ94126.1 15 kDa selenoprotein [Tieghemostelium lacteum]
MISERRKIIPFSFIILLISLVVCTGVAPPKSGDSSLSCHDLGYTEALLCSTCADFEEFVGDNEFIDECKRCCSKESQNSAFPHIKEFIDKKSGDYKKLSVRYESGSNPKLVLKDNEGKEETLSIDSWKTENLEEYLKENNL